MFYPLFIHFLILEKKTKFGSKTSNKSLKNCISIGCFLIFKLLYNLTYQKKKIAFRGQHCITRTIHMLMGRCLTVKQFRFYICTHIYRVYVNKNPGNIYIVLLSTTSVRKYSGAPSDNLLKNLSRLFCETPFPCLPNKSNGESF